MTLNKTVRQQLRATEETWNCCALPGGMQNAAAIENMEGPQQNTRPTYHMAQPAILLGR